MPKRTQTYNSVICEYFLLDLLILLDYTNLFLPNKYIENDKIILKYF